MADQGDNEEKGIVPFIRAGDVGIHITDDEFRESSEAFEASQSTVYVDPDGNARQADIEFPEHVSQRSSDNVPEAEFVDPDAPNASGPSASSDVPSFDRFATDRERGQDAVERYVAAIRTWRSGADVANRADIIEELKGVRLEAIQTIHETGFLAHEDLKDLEPYVRSDMAFLERPEAAEEDYAQFVRRQTHLREQIFGNDEILVDAKSYSDATQRFQNFIVDEKNIQLQYDLLSVRRDAALEHFDDPRFIAEIGLHEAKLRDELLIDFDRGDLLNDQGRSNPRSKALAATFGEAVNRGLNAPSSVDQLQSFMSMRAAGLAIRHDQMAIMEFARDTRDNKLMHEMGLAALDDVTYSDDVAKGWFDRLSTDDQQALRDANSPVTFFQVARREFDQNMKDGDSRQAAASFAVLEQTGKVIQKSSQNVARLRDSGSIEDVNALKLFEQGSRDRMSDRVAEQVEKTVDAKMAAGNTLTTEGRRSGEATKVDKETGQEVYKLDLAQHGKTAKVSAVDGAHVLISNTEADAEAGKGVIMRLDGITAPPEGVQTRSGALDAGEYSRENLRLLLNRYEHQGLGIKVSANDKGEKVAQITLNSGEDLSNRMVVDGCAMPTMDSPGKIRRENLANQAEAQRRGLWRHGFPEMDESWRSERSGPTLSANDKRDRLCETVGNSVAGSKDDAHRRLMRKDTKLFALAVEDWSADYRIDEAVMKVAKTNPGRLKDIYANNMEMLTDLRKRKGKLTDEEKLAHDRLSLGRRAIAKSLHATGHMTEEQCVKDSHPLMSRKARAFNMEALRPAAEFAAKSVEATTDAAKFSAKQARGFAKGILDTAME